MSTGQPFRLICHEYGDAGLLVDVEADDDPSRWSTAQALGDALREAPLPGLIDVVASYQSVFVSFEPLLLDHDQVQIVVRSLCEATAIRRPPRQFVVPVVYGGECGPDLETVAAQLSMRTVDVVDRHLSQPWIVRFVGSPVGAPMMDGPGMPSPVSRLAQPRARVEPGSVAVSGSQSMIYNAPSPGGWQLIGRTPARLFDLHQPPHVPYRAGDRIQFRRIPMSEWSRWTVPLVAGGVG